jgi:glycosyltransferase involved in cell wall biosynthesis
LKKINIVHISHTDINNDSRILKSIDAIKDIEGVQVQGIGLKQSSEKKIINNKYKSYNLKIASLMKRMPRHVRLIFLLPFFSFIEFVYFFFISLLKMRPNIVHAHDSLALVPGYIYSRIFNCKLIYDAHELESKKNQIGKMQSKVINLIEKIAWPRINAFITVSEPIKKWYLDTYGSKKSTIILNAPLIDNVKIESKTLRQQLSLRNDELIAVYIGYFVKGRGIEDIIQLARRLRNIHFAFVGSGQLKQKIKVAADNLDNISIHPFVKHDQLVNYLEGCDLGLCLLENVSLSDYYAIPNKLLEYAFSGLYVICSNFPEMSRIVKKYNIGECLSSDLAEAQKIFTDSLPSKINKRKLQSKESLYELSWSAQEEKLIDLYSYLINKF